MLRAEGNTTYGNCILPSFQELFRAASAALGACSIWLVKKGKAHASITLSVVFVTNHHTHHMHTTAEDGEQPIAPLIELYDFDVKEGQFPAPETWGDYHGPSVLIRTHGRVPAPCVNRIVPPSLSFFNAHTGFLLPGSYSSANETEPWIQEFKRFIR